MRPTATLEDIIDALQRQGNTPHAFYDRHTASVVVVVVTDEGLVAAEDGEAEDLLADAPEWERGSIALAQAVAADESDRFAYGDRPAYAYRDEHERDNSAALACIHGQLPLDRGGVEQPASRLSRPVDRG